MVLHAPTMRTPRARGNAFLRAKRASARGPDARPDAGRGRAGLRAGGAAEEETGSALPWETPDTCRGAKSCRRSGATPCARPERGTKVQPVQSRGAADANQRHGQPKPETRPGMPPTQGRKSARSAAGRGCGALAGAMPGHDAGRAARRSAARVESSARLPAPPPHKGLASRPVFPYINPSPNRAPWSTIRQCVSTNHSAPVRRSAGQPHGSPPQAER